MRLLLLAALLLPAAASPPRDAKDAQAFLEKLYRAYGPGKEGARLDRPERYFEPELAAAIRADQEEADRLGDMSKMDADPFCDCQDFEGMSPARVEAVSLAPDGRRATAEVHFAFGNEPMRLRYTLIWTGRGWRIHDLEWQEHGKLREIYFPS